MLSLTLRPGFLGPATSTLIFLSITSVLLTNVALPVHALPGFAPTDPGNVWAPYGPMVKNLQFQYYLSENAEFNGFIAAQLDLLDWPAPQSLFRTWDNNQDFLLTPTQGQFGDFGIFFNGASSTWKTWGCDWAANFDTTIGSNGDVVKPTVPTPQIYNNTRRVDSPAAVAPWIGYSGVLPYSGGVACDVNMRQAFAHLLDRPRWVVDGILRGPAVALADNTVPSKTPSGSTLAEQCTWDKMFPNCISAFRLAENPGGFAQPGSPDFCAAADHMIAAGVATGKGTDCRLTGVNSGVFVRPIRFMIRNDKPPRVQFANGWMNALNQLFGGIAARPSCIGRPSICNLLVLSDPPTTPIDDWDAYTYGYGLPSAFPAHFFFFYNSQFATDYCGGIQNDFPGNVQFVCNAKVDSTTNTAQSTADIPTFNIATTKVMSLLGRLAVDIPVYSDGIRTAALRTVDGLVNEVGVGYPNTWTILNGRQGSYSPVNPMYQFGGGDPTTLRWGQASEPQYLNPFRAQTYWEFNVIAEVYDTLFNSSPVEPTRTFCNMCNTATTSSTPPFVAGDTIYDVILRPNLRFHDGTPITAHDVAFSALNLPRFSSSLGGRLLLLRGIKVISATELFIEWQGQSIADPLDMQFFVLPAHVWEDTSVPAPDRCAENCTWGVAQGTSGESNLVSNDIHPLAGSKASSTYDPILQGTFIGSGPFMCRSLFPEDYGRVGTGCAMDGAGMRIGESIPVGGTMLLQAFDRTSEPGNSDPFLQYMRSYNSAWGTGTGATAHSGAFQEFRWADRYGNATVTVRDLVSVAGCYGASGPRTNCPASEYNYWHRSAFETTPGTISGEVAIVASHLDETWVYPFSWSGDQSAQPVPTLQNIIPFNQP